MANTGITYPGTSANNTAIGTYAWNNPGNATADDGVNTTARGPTGTNQISNYLRATNFGFSIPTGSNIDGILVEIERRRENANNGTEHTVSLVKGGTVSGDNKADTATNMPTTMTNKSFGSSSDLWGLSFTVADINASDFGVVFSVSMTRPGFKSFNDGIVDFIRITVHYTEVAGGSPQMHQMMMAGGLM